MVQVLVLALVTAMDSMATVNPIRHRMPDRTRLRVRRLPVGS